MISSSVKPSISAVSAKSAEVLSRSSVGFTLFPTPFGGSMPPSLHALPSGAQATDVPPVGLTRRTPSCLAPGATRLAEPSVGSGCLGLLLVETRPECSLNQRGLCLTMKCLYRADFENALVLSFFVWTSRTLLSLCSPLITVRCGACLALMPPSTGYRVPAPAAVSVASLDAAPMLNDDPHCCLNVEVCPLLLLSITASCSRVARDSCCFLLLVGCADAHWFVVSLKAFAVQSTLAVLFCQQNKFNGSKAAASSVDIENQVGPGILWVDGWDRPADPGEEPCITCRTYRSYLPCMMLPIRGKGPEDRKAVPQSQKSPSMGHVEALSQGIALWVHQCLVASLEADVCYCDPAPSDSQLPAPPAMAGPSAVPSSSSTIPLPSCLDSGFPSASPFPEGADTSPQNLPQPPSLPQPIPIDPPSGPFPPSFPSLPNSSELGGPKGHRLPLPRNLEGYKNVKSTVNVPRGMQHPSPNLPPSFAADSVSTSSKQTMAPNLSMEPTASPPLASWSSLVK
ncbi:hypothetical protein Nepgr_006756 [Nepenthes gracilis]|uniref:Uncharacterized protein n=1 Tax=Nepenthes gracilis TaxID=150966 RepID=A0AAD3S5V3_NEPGR|nr:hypothetical protein Nepgr_006756 [Nepenthes gracilis]